MFSGAQKCECTPLPFASCPLTCLWNSVRLQGLSTAEDVQVVARHDPIVHRRALTKHDDLVPPPNMPYFSGSKPLRRVGSDWTTSTPRRGHFHSLRRDGHSLVVASPWPLPHRCVATAAPLSSRRHSRSLNVAKAKAAPLTSPKPKPLP